MYFLKKSIVSKIKYHVVPIKLCVLLKETIRIIFLTIYFLLQEIRGVTRSLDQSIKFLDFYNNIKNA